MRFKFQNWYVQIICQQLEDKEVDMRLSVMKQLIGKWIVDMYHFLTSKPDIIVNGFHKEGIIDILK